MKDKTVKREKSLNEFREMRERLHDHEQPDDEFKDFIELQSILKKVFDTMQIGVTTSDVNGRILYVNPADAEMHAYKVEELLGEDVRIFAPTKRWNPMNPEEIKSLHKWKRESANLRKDGSIFAAQLMSNVITDTGGKVIGIITTCEDITDRKAMEEKLKEVKRSSALW